MKYAPNKVLKKCEDTLRRSSKEICYVFVVFDISHDLSKDVQVLCMYT